MHRATWPSAEELDAGGDAEVYAVAAAVLGAIRKAKALAKITLRAPVKRAVVRDTAERLAKLGLAEDEIREAGNVEKLELVEADESSIEVELDDGDA